MSQLKLEEAQELLDRGCTALGLQPTVKIAQLKYGSVWVLAYDQDLQYPNFSWNMIDLERWLKAEAKTMNIELQCEALSDKNKRHLRMGIEVADGASLRGIESLD